MLISIIVAYSYPYNSVAGVYVVTDKYKYKNDYIITVEYDDYYGSTEIKLKLGKGIKVSEDNKFVKKVNSQEAYDLI